MNPSKLLYRNLRSFPPHSNNLIIKITLLVYLISGLLPASYAQSGCLCGGNGLDLSGSSGILLSELIVGNQLPPGGTSIGCISVPENTTLTVDVDYTFSGTTLVTAGNSRIVVEPAIRLTLQDTCDLISCDGGYWHIFLQSGSASPAFSGGQLDMSNSGIKGGITANHLSRIRLVNNQFNGGGTALMIRGYVPFIHLGDPYDFNNNSFVGYYNPINLELAYSFNIGSPTPVTPAIVNYIFGYGILGPSSNTSGVLIQSCLDIGIYDLDISGFFASSKNDDRKAIWVRNSRKIEIERCNIHPTFSAFGLPAFGIHGESIFDTISIRDNEITSRGTGVLMENNFVYNRCNIANNSINSQKGIEIKNGRSVNLAIYDNQIKHHFGGVSTSIPGGISLFNIKGSYEISENEIEEESNAFDTTYGWGDHIRNISIASCSARGRISGNTITYPVTLPATGIGIFASKNLSVAENILTGRLNDANQGHGIDVINSVNMYLCCNSVDSTDYGTRFSSANNDVRFFTTTYGAHDTALYFPPAAYINKQYNTGNDWAGANTELDAFYNGTLNQAIVNAPFRTASSNINATKTLPIGWFILNGSDPSCYGTVYTCTEGLPNDSLVLLTDSDLLALDEPDTENEYVLRFEQQRLLYRKLREYPEFIEWNEDVSNFYEHADTSIIGEMDALDEAFRRGFSLSSSLEQQFDDFKHLSDSLSALVDGIYTQFPSASESEREDLLEYLMYLADQIVTAQYESDTLFSLAKVEMMENLRQLLENNETLPVTEIWEGNEKFINILFFKYFGGVIDSFTNAEKSDIIALANTCPQYEGAGVFKARLLRGTFIDSTFNGYYDNSCIAEERNSKSISKVTFESSLTLHPNPASDLVFISLGNNFPSEGWIIIRNSAGQIISSQMVPEGQVIVDIKGLPVGIYWIMYYSESRYPVGSKLVISR